MTPRSTQIKKSTTKDLSLIAVFAYNNETNNKSLIASIIYKYDFFNIRYSDNRRWDVSNFRSEYNEPFNIIRVLKRRDNIINNIYNYKDKDYDLNKTFLNISRSAEQKYINHILILDHLFFTEEFLDDYLFSNKFNLINSAFIFDHTEWKDLVHKFKKLNITLSGGSNTKRQVLSPVQLNLARFVISIDGFKESHKSVVNSFNIHEEVHGKVFINNFSKNDMIWLLREYIRLIPNPEDFNIGFTDKNRADFYNAFNVILYLNNLHAQKYIKILFNNMLLNNQNNFIEQLKQLIETTKVNFELDVKFLDQEYLDIFLKKLYTLDLKNYPLEKRFKSFEEFCIALKTYKSKVYGLKKSQIKNLNRSNKKNTAGLGVRKYSTTIKYIKFKDSTMNDESIKSYKLNETKLDSTSQITTIDKNLNDRNFYFLEIKKLLENNELNENTQKKLETLGFQHKLINVDNNNIWEQINNIELKNFLFEVNNDLISNINVLKTRNEHNLYFNGSEVTDYDKIDNQKKKIYILVSKLLSELNHDIIISILLGNILLIFNQQSIEENYSSKVFNKIGDKLLYSYFNFLYNNEKLKKKKNKKNYFNYTLSKWKTENYKFVECFVDNTFKHNLGAKVIEWLWELDLLEFDNHRSAEDEKNPQFIKASKKVENFINNKNKIPLNLPDKLPMIVKPKEFNKAKLGGFLLNDEMFIEKPIIDNYILSKNAEIDDKNIIYDTINNLSSIGYKINKDVYNFILEYNDKFNLTLINSKHKLEDKKEKLGKHQLIELTSFKSKRFVDESILNIADCYINVKEFFIPVRIDYRGRIYCNSSFLNYQGNELAKSLLMFSKGEKINKNNWQSVNYLKIYGANCFGNKLNKESATTRINWVNDNHENIINFENGILIEQAESKLLFIAFCFEYRNFHSESYSEKGYFYTHLPIQLDATCNGLQHISMLGLDKDLIKLLNIKESTVDDKPEDFYSIIANLINGTLKIRLAKEKEKMEPDSEIIESYERLLKLELFRDIIKKCIMTLPYNATPLQGIKYLREGFGFYGVIYKDELNNIIGSEFNYDLEKAENITKEYWFKYSKNNIILKSSDFTHLYHILKEVLYDSSKSIKKITDYLGQIAEICAKANTFIPWVLPTGLKIYQGYNVLTEIRISPFNFKNFTYTLKTNKKQQMDTAKNIRAFMPNLIHSLDATSLSLLVNNYFNFYDNEIKNIYGIHDCFATTFNNMSFIVENLKLIYISLYSDRKYLKELDDNIINHIKNYVDVNFDGVTVKKVTFLDSKKKRIVLDYPDINTILKDIDFDISFYIKKSSYLIN
jgi:DNA-dependent RNA polymerase